jgi:CHAD domain-containing protein
MAEGKWIEGLDAETPVVQAARHAVAVRLDVVRMRLPQAVHEADADPEYVHQLRVSTRRADAALRIFQDCLPRKIYKYSRKRLRRLRRAAGAARDWDVFLAEVVGRLPSQAAGAKPGLDFLAGYATGQRVVAHETLTEEGEAQLADFDAFLAEVVDAARPADGNADDTLLSLARPLLADRIVRLESAVAGDLNDYTQLHQVRIAGKRLRYAMEVFAGCFPPSFTDELYQQVEEMQEILGRANDSHVAAERLAGLRDYLRRTRPEGWGRLRVGIEPLLRSHQRRLPQERRRFLRWWDRWRRPRNVAAWRLLIGEPKSVPSPAGK